VPDRIETNVLCYTNVLYSEPFVRNQLPSGLLVKLGVYLIFGQQELKRNPLSLNVGPKYRI
jgi:hypothetical protein